MMDGFEEIQAENSIWRRLFYGEGSQNDFTLMVAFEP